MKTTKNLIDLVSVGKATLEDFHKLDIYTVADLVGHSSQILYSKLCEVTGVKHDICVEDVFMAAIAQANNPLLPEEQKQWHYWSKVRKRNEFIKNK